MAIAVLGMARNKGRLFLIKDSISLMVTPVTTEISNLLEVSSFFIEVRASLKTRFFVRSSLSDNY
jgi:hypothetical protein